MSVKNKVKKLTPYEKTIAACDRARVRNLAKVKSPAYKAQQLAKKKQQIAKQRQRVNSYKPMKKKVAKNKQHSSPETAHIKAVVALGCIVCHCAGDLDTPCTVHHVNSGGMALRSSNFDIIGLCPAHHQTGGYGVAIHAGKKTFEDKHGTEQFLLTKTSELINGAA